MLSVRVRAPAKINIHLAVLGLRQDGYHDIETLFQAVDLYDELLIRKADSDVRLEVPRMPELESEANLVLRALRWLEMETGRPLPVSFRLKKGIPMGGGLGGGSSDAAAALLGVNLLLDLGLDGETLHRGAVQLGSDVAFFLMGGSAVGEGRGERLTPVDVSTDYALLLVNPGFQVSTALVYGEHGRTLTRGRREGRLWQLLRECRDTAGLLQNDLQGPAERLYPEILDIRKALERECGPAVLMSGSGATVFGILEEGLERVSGITKSFAPHWRVIPAVPVSTGLIVD